MIYTVRYAHLHELPLLKVADIVQAGDKIAIAGNTGASAGRHLHIDCVEGAIDQNWKLIQAENNQVKSNPRQLNYFIDKGVFDTEIAITTYYCEPEYQIKYSKVHKAYDVVPKDRLHWDVHWNRTNSGKVVSVGFDKSYGNYLLISFMN